MAHPTAIITMKMTVPTAAKRQTAVVAKAVHPTPTAPVMAEARIAARTKKRNPAENKKSRTKRTAKNPLKNTIPKRRRTE